MTEEAKSKSPPLKFDFVGSKNIRRQKPEAVGCVERSSYTVSRGLLMYVFGHDESLAVGNNNAMTKLLWSSAGRGRGGSPPVIPRA